MEEIIIKAKEGDVLAYTQLILNMKNDLYKIAKTRFINDDEVDDAIQETMIMSYKYLKKLKDPSKFKAWIIKILISNCNKIYNRKHKYKEITEDYDLEGYYEMYKEESNDITEIENTIDFYKLIQNLRYEERIIIILLYQERFTQKEISKILNTNENTIKTRLSRAKIKIKKLYEEVQKNGWIR